MHPQTLQIATLRCARMVRCWRIPIMFTRYRLLRVNNLKAKNYGAWVGRLTPGWSFSTPPKKSVDLCMSCVR